MEDKPSEDYVEVGVLNKEPFLVQSFQRINSGAPVQRANQDEMIKIVNSNEQEPIIRRPKRDKESQIEKAQKNFALNKISHLESRKTPAVNIVDIGHYKLMRPTGRNHSV
jgi:hypothetical protein